MSGGFVVMGHCLPRHGFDFNPWLLYPLWGNDNPIGGSGMDIKDMKIRVPAELKQKLTDRANRNDRTINGEVLQILKTALSAKHPKAA